MLEFQTHFAHQPVVGLGRVREFVYPDRSLGELGYISQTYCNFGPAALRQVPSPLAQGVEQLVEMIWGGQWVDDCHS